MTSVRSEEALQLARHRVTQVRSVDLDRALAAAWRDQVNETGVDRPAGNTSERTHHRRPERRLTPDFDESGDQLIEFSIGHIRS